MGLHSSGGYLTKSDPDGYTRCRPIYDWSTKDVWKAVLDNRWDYNRAYDAFSAMGIPAKLQRVAPPTMNVHGVDLLRASAQAWPAWFDRVARRCPGVRAVVRYGRRAVSPQNEAGETWQQCFERTCLGDGVPEWIRERAARVRDTYLERHAAHSALPFPEVKSCFWCHGGSASWKRMAQFLYMGDPFSTHYPFLPCVEPEFFRPGTGTWGGRPTW
jgi:predicted phosphoadenosine phosphosulfate sulfurtransferase